jgi:fructose-1,6-bisphosphatase/inositol monophosphatase family enzyme
MQRPVTASAESLTHPATGSTLADDLDFSLDLARRAGAVLMDRYERLEQIDYKSARDVVTEADHQ